MVRPSKSLPYVLCKSGFKTGERGIADEIELVGRYRLVPAGFEARRCSSVESDIIEDFKNSCEVI